MTKIKIPTEAELGDRLGGLDRLLTAKRWERAAIVWAFTTGDNGRPKNLPEGGGFPVPMGTFAGLGFAGLTKPDTVARYRRAWQTAIDRGDAQPAAPGEDVDLPDHLPWPDYFDATDGDDRYPQGDRREALVRQAQADGVGPTKVLDVAKNPKAVAAALKADPAFRRAVAEDTSAVVQLENAHHEHVASTLTLTPRPGQVEHEQFAGFLDLLTEFKRLEYTFPSMLRKLKDLPLEQVQPAFQGRAQRVYRWATALRDLLDGDPEFDAEWEDLLGSTTVADDKE